MKKRKNIILSAITCFVSICLLMLGVYSASNPGVSISGQVSYTARDASVLVQGKTSKDGSALVFDTVPSTKNFDGLTEKTSGESYLDWTEGEGYDVAGDQLKAWAVGDLNFVEGTDGVKPIKLGFSFTNYSNFPVEATIVLNTSTLTSTTNVEIVVQTSDEIENNELTKTITLAKGETKSCEFVYKVIDDSKDASGAKIDVKVDFANANSSSTTTTSAYTLSDIERSTGIVTMGKSITTITAEDVVWKCFATSTDGETWEKCTGEIQTSAKFGYFVLDTYVESLGSKVFLEGGKYAKNSSDKVYYINEGVNGLTTANTVYPNDYYYSDIRQTLKGLAATLGISSDNAIYKAIQGRTIEDLYADDTPPTVANASDTDTFWLMSYTEVTTYFDDNSARKWLNGDSGMYYWLRSPYWGADSSGCDCAYLVENNGTVDNNEIWVSSALGARAAFKLKLA